MLPPLLSACSLLPVSEFVGGRTPGLKACVLDERITLPPADGARVGQTCSSVHWVKRTTWSHAEEFRQGQVTIISRTTIGLTNEIVNFNYISGLVTTAYYCSCGRRLWNSHQSDDTQRPMDPGEYTAAHTQLDSMAYKSAPHVLICSWVERSNAVLRSLSRGTMGWNTSWACFICQSGSGYAVGISLWFLIACSDWVRMFRGCARMRETIEEHQGIPSAYPDPRWANPNGPSHWQGIEPGSWFRSWSWVRRRSTTGPAVRYQSPTV